MQRACGIWKEWCLELRKDCLHLRPSHLGQGWVTGYRTPIYILNRIIWLQAVLDLAGHRIDKSLNILSQGANKLRMAVYQNRLALDYLLAKEGGICGKFNLSNYCLQIDETGSVIKQLTTEMRQLTKNEDQVWKGISFPDMFSSWFPKLTGLQAIVALIGLIAAGWVILPCILPIFVHTISTSLSLLADKKATAKAIAWWEYEKLSDLEENTPLHETPQWSDDYGGISKGGVMQVGSDALILISNYAYINLCLLLCLFQG